MIMNVLKEDARDASLMELLYAGNLVLCGESLNEVMDEHGRWKALEGKNLRINVGKTKGMQLLFGTKSSILKMDSCGVFWMGSCNSIQCKKCQRWVHQCSDAPKQVRLLSGWDVFVCRTCLGHNCLIEKKLEFKRVF